MTERVTFGYWLRLRRKAFDLTREVLADRVGCSAATIRKIESEERRPSIQIIERLADIFNIPAEERRGFQQYARGDWRYSPQDTDEPAPWHRTKSSPATNLPVVPTSFIGRDNELAEVEDYLINPKIRLITLIGPPGIGKTRLCIEAARAVLPHFPDGIFFVPLDNIDDQSLVAPAVNLALDFAPAPGMSPSTQLKNGIGDKTMLLVIDNCEHLINDIALLVANLLTANPRLKIAATSREALSIQGEWRYIVPPMRYPAENETLAVESASQYSAIELFGERARSVRPGFVISAENIQAVAAICLWLDGLPLPIELIAAQARLMSPQLLLEQLGDKIRFPAHTVRAVHERQKTYDHAIAWSFEHLLPSEKTIFACLSVFSSGFTMEAAESILAGIGDNLLIPDLIASLADKSLLQSSDEPLGEVRFNMLRTIQEFSSSKFNNLSNRDELRDRHLNHHLRMAEKGDAEIHSSQQSKWVERLDREHNNFRTALGWAVSSSNTEAAIRLLSSLGWAWEIRGHYVEADFWLDKIRSLPDLDQYPLKFTRLLNHIGRYHFSQTNYSKSRSVLEESQKILGGMGQTARANLAETYNWLGLVAVHGENDPESARILFEQSLAINMSLMDDHAIAISNFHLGILESHIKNHAVAQSMLTQSLMIFRDFGDLFYMARVSNFLGYSYLDSGDYQRAELTFREQLVIDSGIRFWIGIADAGRALAFLFHRKGEYEQASHSYETSIEILSDHGLNYSDLLFPSGSIAIHCQYYELAARRFMELLDRNRQSMDAGDLGLALTGLSAVAAGTNQPERAAKLSGAARREIEASGKGLPVDETAEFERHLQMAREQLGEVNFNNLETEGYLMSIEQTIFFANTSPI